MVFTELPIIVVHDTVITDLFATEHVSGYVDSATFVQDYLLIRQAMSNGDKKTAITTPQVVGVLRKRFAEIVSAKPGDAKFELLTSLMGWVEIDRFTEALADLDERGSVYILAHQWGMKRAGSVILLVNDNDMKEKIITYNQKHGRSWVKTWEDIPYQLMNTDDFKGFLRTQDGMEFEKITKMLEELTPEAAE